MKRELTSKRFAQGVVAAALLICGLALTASGQAAQVKTPVKTVWDGIYTVEQAARGKIEYEKHCSNCHGPDLVDSRQIVGKTFLERWREDRLDPLFNYIKMAMPRGAGGSLADPIYLDIFTYVLQRNGFPAGASTLTIPGTSDIDLIAKEGPQPVPDGALVSTIGCMKRGPGNQWLLINATEPRRNRNPYETTQEELRAGQSSPPGAFSFVLDDFSAIPGANPENFEGLRMQAKGFIVRQPGAERINLFSLAFVSATCP